MLKRFLLAMAATIITLCAAEWTLRWLPTFNPRPHFVVEAPQNSGRVFVADPAIGWRLRSHYRSADGRETGNAQGFRSTHDFTSLRDPIAVVGDSFSFGTGVTDSEPYSALIEASLNGPPVANLAMPGFGIDQIWLTVKHTVLPLKPRLIVMGIVELDFERSQKAFDPGKRFTRPWYQLTDGRLVERTSADMPGRLIRTLDAKSRLWRAGQMALQQLGHRYAIGEWWNLNAAFLADIQRLATANGIPVLFIHLPTTEWLPFPMLQRHMARLGAHYIDLRHGPVAPDGFFLSDGHPSVQGHQRIADEIQRWLREHPNVMRTPVRPQ